MKSDKNLIFEKYINTILKEEFSSNINKENDYAIWGVPIDDKADNVGEGSERQPGQYVDTVENMLWSSVMGDISIGGIMNSVGIETGREEEPDVRISDGIVESIGCTLDDDPLLIKGRYEAAIAYRVRANTSLLDYLFVVTDDERFSNWDLAYKNFNELKNMAISNFRKMMSAGKSSKHLIPGINYTGILHFLD